MKINYEKKFLKDIEKLDKDVSLKLKKLIIKINQVEEIKNIKDIKKLVGYENYFRIKIGDYRLGFRFENNEIFFIRFKHRKDIYKMFP